MEAEASGGAVAGGEAEVGGGDRFGQVGAHERAVLAPFADPHLRAALE